MNAVFHERFLNKNNKLNTIYPVNIEKKKEMNVSVSLISVFLNNAQIF